MRRGSFVAALVAMVFVLAAQASAVDYTANGERFSDAFGGGLDANFVNAGGGDLYTNMMGSSVMIQREFRRALPSIYSYSQTAHYQNRADAGGASNGALANFDSSSFVYCPTTMCAPGNKWVMWDVPFVIRDTQKKDKGYLGYENSVSGFATGISRMLGESSAIGLAVGYDSRKMYQHDNYSFKNKGDTLHLALYGGTNIGCFFFDAYAGYSRTWNRTNREMYSAVVNPAWNASKAKGNFNDTVLSAGLKASYVWILGNDMRITPSVGVDFSHERQDTFHEKHAVIGNRYRKIDGDNYTNVAIPVMISANYTFSSSWLAFGGHRSLWTPEIRGGFIPVLGDKRAEAKITANDNLGNPTSFKSKSSEFGRSHGTVGAGLKIKLRDKYIFAVDYDYTFASKYSNHSITAMYGVSF